jgi:sugar-specific transcriptional regulator TrmB
LLPIDKDVEMLCEFGLTPNQARVYLAICQLGIDSVGKVSRVSRVRREDVYRILPKLEKMGLIEKILGTPAKIRATPLEEALSLLIKHEKDTHDQKLTTLITKKDELLNHFKEKRKLTVEEEDTEFSLISGREAILSKATNILKHVNNEIDMIASRRKLFGLLTALALPFKQAIKRGAKMRIITELPEEEDPLPRLIEENLSPGASVKLKYAETLPSHFIIFDNREMMISTTTHGAMAEYPALWTNNGPLIEPLQKTFEDMWHSSMNWSNFKAESETERLKRFITQLKPTDHVIFVYETQESKYDVLFNYIRHGLENGEAAVYVCSEATPAQIKTAMKLFGIDVEKYEKANALNVLHYKEFYIIDGKFSIENTLSLWNKYYQEALAKGFKGLRVTGEMACFFEHNLVKDLLEYEKSLHKVLSIPIVAICSYRSDKLKSVDDPIALYRELTKAHGAVLYEGTDQTLGRMVIR